MGFKIVEYHLRTALSNGIATLRKDVDLLDDVFADLLCYPLNDMYGKKIVDDIKCFFRDNDVPVLMAYGQNQIQLPSITVHMISSQEAPEYRAMIDHVGFIRTPKRASRLAGPLYAKAYDPETGKLTFDKNANLELFIKGRKLFARRSDEVYTLKPKFVINSPTATPEKKQDQIVHIVDCNGDIPDNIDFAELYLLSSIDFDVHRLAAATFRETFEIRVNAQTNTDQAMWLYYIVAYVLMRNKAELEDLGLESQTFSTSEFTRDVGKAPNSIWGRTLRFTFLVQHTWQEEVQPLEIAGVDVNVETSVTNLIVNGE